MSLLVSNCIFVLWGMLVVYLGMWFATASTKNVDETKLDWHHFLMGLYMGIAVTVAHGFGLGLGTIAQTGQPVQLSWMTYALCFCLYSTAALLGSRQGLRSGLDKSAEHKPKPVGDDWDREMV